MVFSSKLKKKYLDKNIYNDYIWRNLIFMSLIKCYECSKEISDIAEACPHCGAGKAVECHECSKQISKGLNKCPHCGVPKLYTFKINRNIHISISFLLLPVSIFYCLYWLIEAGPYYLDEGETLYGVFHFIIGSICLIISLILSKVIYNNFKSKDKEIVKTYKVNSIRFNSILHLISSLILLTSSCFLWTYLMQRTVLEFMFGVSGFIDIFGATIFITLVISLIYFIVSRLINKPTSFLSSFYITSYLITFLWIISSVIYSIKIWG
jgi:hypothetical protein